jgi:hypothetical protein
VYQTDDDAEAAQGRKVAQSADVLNDIAECKTQADLTALFKSLSTEDRAAHMDAFSARKKVVG